MLLGFYLKGLETLGLRPSLIFRTQINICYEIRGAFWPSIDSNTTDVFKAQKGSKINFDARSMDQAQYYETTGILFVRKEKKNNNFI